MQPLAPTQIPANELRPGRHWYAAAAAIAVVLTVLAAMRYVGTAYPERTAKLPR